MRIALISVFTTFLVGCASVAVGADYRPFAAAVLVEYRVDSPEEVPASDKSSDVFIGPEVLAELEALPSDKGDGFQIVRRTPTSKVRRRRGGFC